MNVDINKLTGTYEFIYFELIWFTKSQNVCYCGNRGWRVESIVNMEIHFFKHSFNKH